MSCSHHLVNTMYAISDQKPGLQLNSMLTPFGQHNVRHQRPEARPPTQFNAHTIWSTQCTPSVTGSRASNSIPCSQHWPTHHQRCDANTQCRANTIIHHTTSDRMPAAHSISFARQPWQQLCAGGGGTLTGYRIHTNTHSLMHAHTHAHAHTDIPKHTHAQKVKPSHVNAVQLILLSENTTARTHTHICVHTHCCTHGLIGHVIIVQLILLLNESRHGAFVVEVARTQLCRSKGSGTQR